MKRLLLAVLVVRCAVAEEMSMVVRPTSAAGEVGMKICAVKKPLFRSFYVRVQKSHLQLYTIT